MYVRIKILEAETPLVLFWCLSLTLWRVKYCQGWSSVRFVTLLPSSALSEPHSQRYLLTIWQPPRIRAHCLPCSQFRAGFVCYISVANKPGNYPRDLDNFISLTVLHLFSRCKIPTKIVRIQKIFFQIFFHFYLFYSGLS